MDHLFFVVFREPDYRRCLMSNPPMLANHDEDRIGASVFRDLIGERNLVLTPGFPDLRRFPRADIVIGFDLAALQSPQAIAFSALQNAYITAMEQEEPLTEPQVRFFKSALQQVSRFEHDQAFVSEPLDLRTASVIGVRTEEALARIRDASVIPHVRLPAA